MALLELKNVSAGYGKNIILKDFCIDIEEGKLVSLLGSSGCGKTTTLRTMAGFIDVVKGQFLFDGQDYTRTPIHKRGFGYVFQSYALFPHLSVFDNVAFGLKRRHVNHTEIKERVTEMLTRVGLAGFEDRLPADMSGGQRQRVALARALVLKPRVLLMDEPLSNLDARLRVEMRVEIRRLQQEMGITAVYVTHDQEECFSISDQVAIMNNGRIEQMDTPMHIFNYPVNEFTARFVGFENFVPVTLENGRYVSASGTVFETDKTAPRLKAACRPDDLQLLPGHEGGIMRLRGEIVVATFLGKQMQYLVHTREGDFLVNTAAEALYAPHDPVTVCFPREKTIFTLDETPVTAP